MAMGEPFDKTHDAEGNEMWMYARSNDVILDVWFDEKQGHVVHARARKATESTINLSKALKNKATQNARNARGMMMRNATPLEEIKIKE